MRWVCPHCKTSLETALLQNGAGTSTGPRPGWTFARCYQCDQFAEVEMGTGASNAINPKTFRAPQAVPAVKPQQVTPPPFTHADPVAPAAPTTAAAPAVFEDFLKTADFSACLTTFAPPETAPLRARSPLISPRFSVLLSGTGLLTIAAGSIMLWNAHTATHSPHASTASAGTPLERSHQAAERLTSEPKPAARNALPQNITTAPPARLASATELSDTLRSQAMAPRRPRPDDIQLYLQARKSTRAMELRTGPGTEFALLGLADLDERYPVVEVKDRWFRIQLDETPGLTAWVAYERVELFSQDLPKEDDAL